MHRQNRKIRVIGALGVSLGLLLAACGTQGASDGASASPEGSEPVDSSEAPAEAVEVEWFVGLGTGENEEQIATEEEVVAAFNEAHDDIELVLTIVDNTEASTTLATRIAAGDAPDIIGPSAFAACSRSATSCSTSGRSSSRPAWTSRVSSSR